MSVDLSADLRKWAFVDECGSSALDSSKDCVSHLFICVAVVVDDENLSLCRSGLRNVQEKFGVGSEIKSSKIGKKHDRRLKMLEMVCDLPFCYYAVIINKDRIKKSSGLQYKRSFYKYVNDMLYQILAKSGMSMSVVADPVGGEDFINSLKAYVLKKGYDRLFTSFDYDCCNSVDEPLIQLADLIAGTLSYCFDSKNISDYSLKFRSLLKDKEVGIKCWPIDWALQSEVDRYNSCDDILSAALIRRAVNFISKYENDSDTDRKMQVLVLDRLLFSRSFEEKQMQSMYADNLIYVIDSELSQKLNRQALSSRVIGPIRDDGVIIAGSNEGYRLALSLEDIDDYLSHDRNIIGPMLSRLKMARETVKIDTLNVIDILKNDEFEILRYLLDTYVGKYVECNVAKDIQ